MDPENWQGNADIGVATGGLRTKSSQLNPTDPPDKPENLENPAIENTNRENNTAPDELVYEKPLDNDDSGAQDENPDQHNQSESFEEHPYHSDQDPCSSTDENSSMAPSSYGNPDDSSIYATGENSNNAAELDNVDNLTNADDPRNVDRSNEVTNGSAVLASNNLNENVGENAAQPSVLEISYSNSHSNFPDDQAVDFSAAFPSNSKSLLKNKLHSSTLSAALNSSSSEPAAKSPHNPVGGSFEGGNNLLPSSSFGTTTALGNVNESEKCPTLSLYQSIIQLPTEINCGQDSESEKHISSASHIDNPTSHQLVEKPCTNSASDNPVMSSLYNNQSPPLQDFSSRCLRSRKVPLIPTITSRSGRRGRSSRRNESPPDTLESNSMPSLSTAVGGRSNSLNLPFEYWRSRSISPSIAPQDHDSTLNSDQSMTQSVVSDSTEKKIPQSGFHKNNSIASSSMQAIVQYASSTKKDKTKSISTPAASASNSDVTGDGTDNDSNPSENMYGSHKRKKYIHVLHPKKRALQICSSSEDEDDHIPNIHSSSVVSYLPDIEQKEPKKEGDSHREEKILKDSSETMNSSSKNSFLLKPFSETPKNSSAMENLSFTLDSVLKESLINIKHSMADDSMCNSKTITEEFDNGEPSTNNTNDCIRVPTYTVKHSESTKKLKLARKRSGTENGAFKADVDTVQKEAYSFNDSKQDEHDLQEATGSKSGDDEQRLNEMAVESYFHNAPYRHSKPFSDDAKFMLRNIGVASTSSSFSIIDRNSTSTVDHKPVDLSIPSQEDYLRWRRKVVEYDKLIKFQDPNSDSDSSDDTSQHKLNQRKKWIGKKESYQAKIDVFLTDNPSEMDTKCNESFRVIKSPKSFTGYKSFKFTPKGLTSKAQAEPQVINESGTANKDVDETVVVDDDDDDTIPLSIGHRRTRLLKHLPPMTMMGSRKRPKHFYRKRRGSDADVVDLTVDIDSDNGDVEVLQHDKPVVVSYSTTNSWW